ncbi:hypothetical protein AB6A40_002600 [Gnathostoma spinigerum]|uniref:ELMO domain-containing protein n=1 Tax=Gnathostoma spinigerum TaxID=75299 RepID=A0ABD6E8E3_9BILA
MSIIGYERPSLVFQFLSFIYRYVVRVLLRYFRQLLTGKSDIERILDGDHKHQAEVTAQVKCLIDEKELPFVPSDWTESEEEDLADYVVEAECQKTGDKGVGVIRENFKKSLAQIRGIRRLCAVVEELRAEKYDRNNPKHEKKLLKLWQLLMPNVELCDRKSSQWEEIGFQGQDPATDFRGMGILALEQLLFFSQFDHENACRILTLSHHPAIGFPMAVVGISLTALIRLLLMDGHLNNHFYNTANSAPTLDNFHHAYCRLFVLFAEVWKRERPSSLMYFNEFKDRFSQNLIEYLSTESADLDELDAEML